MLIAAKEAPLISHMWAKSGAGDIGESISSDSAPLPLPLKCSRQTGAVMQRAERRHQSSLAAFSARHCRAWLVAAHQCGLNGTHCVYIVLHYIPGPWQLQYLNTHTHTLRHVRWNLETLANASMMEERSRTLLDTLHSARHAAAMLPVWHHVLVV